jgi:hypothetical protein
MINAIFAAAAADQVARAREYRDSVRIWAKLVGMSVGRKF